MNPYFLTGVPSKILSYLVRAIVGVAAAIGAAASPDRNTVSLLFPYYVISPFFSGKILFIFSILD